MTNKEAIAHIFEQARQEKKNLLAVISGLANTLNQDNNLANLGLESILANLIEPELEKEQAESE